MLCNLRLGKRLELRRSKEARWVNAKRRGGSVALCEHRKIAKRAVKLIEEESLSNVKDQTSELKQAGQADIHEAKLEGVPTNRPLVANDRGALSQASVEDTPPGKVACLR